jgi:acetoin utilization deacetylase AcuC-like enzyme
VKIFHDPKSLLGLPDYGIEVPLTDGRALQTAEFLRQRGVPICDLRDAPSVGPQELLAVHSEPYVHSLFAGGPGLERAVAQTFELINPDGSYHRFSPTPKSLPLSNLLATCLLQAQGALAATSAALEQGSSYYLGGGLHHAMSFGGRGFCLINDIVIAARWAQRVRGMKRIWVIDVDAHKGDGTAELTQNDPAIRTLSIHMKSGWPLEGPRLGKAGELLPWFIPSDVDVEIGPGEELRYLSALARGLERLASLDPGKPDLAIIVQGADPYEHDGLPSSSPLKLTQGQMLQRDLLVYEFLNERQIPQVYLMSGGYGDQAHQIYCQFLAAVLN